MNIFFTIAARPKADGMFPLVIALGSRGRLCWAIRSFSQRWIHCKRMPS